jgi:hypothetical protein
VLDREIDGDADGRDPPLAENVPPLRPKSLVPEHRQVWVGIVDPEFAERQPWLNEEAGRVDDALAWIRACASVNGDLERAVPSRLKANRLAFPVSVPIEAALLDRLADAFEQRPDNRRAARWDAG